MKTKEREGQGWSPYDLGSQELNRNQVVMASLHCRSFVFGDEELVWTGHTSASRGAATTDAEQTRLRAELLLANQVFAYSRTQGALSFSFCLPKESKTDLDVFRSVLHTFGVKESKESALLADVSDLFGSARGLLELGDDWDGERSPGYKPETLERARRLVESLALRILLEKGRVIDLPIVGPGPQGGIDLHWPFERFEALFTVPASPDSPICFFVRNREGSQVEGETHDADLCQLLVEWFSR